MTAERSPTIAVFRPDDGRLAAAADYLETLGAEPVADPMLAIEPTGATPETADFVVFTSKTGAELAADADWDAGAATICAIGSSTATALRAAGYEVDLVPEEYSSSGLVEALADRVDGRTVEVARSDHGSPTLLEGLRDAGASVHETVLYRLVRPGKSGNSVGLATRGELDGAAFTSSLTVEHFLEAAAERELTIAAREALASGTVGAIGEPTSRTLSRHGIPVDVMPDQADVEALLEAVVAAAETDD